MTLYGLKEGYYSNEIKEISDNEGFNPNFWVSSSPPNIPEGMYATWVGEWVITDVPPFSQTLEYKKNELLNILANKRYEVEIGGIEVNGLRIKTDRDSQMLISGAYLSAKNNVISSFNFKTEFGFFSLSSQEIIVIGEAVANHVQSCFTKEKELYELIINSPTIDNIDLTSGWPF